MSKPTLEDFLDSAAKWNGEHRGIHFELSWHGRSDYSPQGTWCYYIRVNSEEFYAEDWAKLRLERQDRQLLGSSWHRHYGYETFPDLDAHGGWTFGEMDTYLGRDGKEHESVKVGCDYAHLWDRESGFWQGREEIERDAKRSIELLCEMFPRRRPRCAYSGQYDDADQFYTARNGRLIHKSQENKLPEGWVEWRPADEAAA
jgi:hypothetical protein